MASIKTMSVRRVSKFEVMNFQVDFLGNRDLPLAEQANQKTPQSVHSLFAGAGARVRSFRRLRGPSGASERMRGVR